MQVSLQTSIRTELGRVGPLYLVLTEFSQNSMLFIIDIRHNFMAH